MARRSGVKGAGRVRRMLRRLPDAVRFEIVGLFRSIGPRLLGYARAASPDSSGRLDRLMSFKVFAKTLRLRVGLLGRRPNRDAFYGYILEVGRGWKKSTATVRRRTSNGVISYRMRISRIPSGRYDMVQGRAKALARNLVRPALAQIYKRALRRAASGGGD